MRQVALTQLVIALILGAGLSGALHSDRRYQCSQ